MTYKDFESMPLCLCVEDVADTLAIAKSKAYRLVNSGELRSLKIGQHYRIPREAFIDFIKRASPPA